MQPPHPPPNPASRPAATDHHHSSPSHPHFDTLQLPFWTPLPPHSSSRFRSLAHLKCIQILSHFSTQEVTLNSSVVKMCVPMKYKCFFCQVVYKSAKVDVWCCWLCIPYIARYTVSIFPWTCARAFSMMLVTQITQQGTFYLVGGKSVSLSVPKYASGELQLTSPTFSKSASPTSTNKICYRQLCDTDHSFTLFLSLL